MEGSIQWIWRSWVPHGRPSMIAGPAGSGKHLLASWLATVVLRGGPCPDGVRPIIDPDRPVVWLDTEGKYERLRELLLPIDFPKDRFFWPVDPQKPEEDSPVNLAEERWLEIVARHAAYRRPAWLIVNCLGTRHGEPVPGTHRALDALADIARDTGSAVTVLYHQDIAQATRPGRSGQWARIAAKMATIMVLRRWAPATKDMQFKVIKTVFGDRPDPLRLRFDSDIPEVVHRPVSPPRSPVDRAVAYLEGELAGGPRSAFEVTDRAWWQNQISPRTLQRAKRQLEVRSYKSAGRWWWILG